MIPTIDAGSATPAYSFSTDDRDEAQDRLTTIFVEHELHIAGAGDNRLGHRINVVPSDSFVLARLGFGVGVRIVAPPMERRYQVNVPVAGSCTVSQSGRCTDSPTGAVAFVMRPNDELTMDWAPDTTQLAMNISADLIAAQARRLAGGRDIDDLDIDLSFPTDTGAGASFRAAVTFLYSELARPGGISSIPQARHDLEVALVNHLLCVAPSRLSRMLTEHDHAGGDRRVADVVDYIEHHPDLDLDIADLTAFAGVGVRSLQRMFREALGVTPTAYLRQTRLDRVRDDLLAGRGSVTEASTRWGFYHPGHFARFYHDRFGETPSQTRRTKP